MNTEIIEKFRTLTQALGYQLYFGTKTNYGTKRDWEAKEIILEPFDFPLERGCQYVTEFRLWIGIKTPIRNKFSGTLGDNTQIIDELHEEAGKLYDAMMETNWLRPTQSKQNIKVRVYMGNSNATMNSQNFGQLTIPVKIWQ